VRRLLTSFLCGSLALNLLLGWACWSKLFGVPLLAPAILRASSQLGSGPAPAQRQALNNLVSVTNAARLFDWRAVESDDYRQYIANLRRLQCPDKTIRDIIVADVNELYRHRFLQEFPPTNRVEYWKPGDALANVITEDQVARLQEFGREKRDLIRNLLGSDYLGDIELTSIQDEIFLDRLLDFLTPEKRSAMQELERRHTAKIMAAANSALRGNNASSKAVEEENDLEALKVLTPNEKLEYDLRRSNQAMYLRVALGDFELTEQEFRAVFPAMKEFIKDAGIQSLMLVVGGDGDPREITQPARAQMQAKVTAALGQKRFTELVEGTGWNLSNQ
jgi:hypothetical protein